LLNLVMFQKAQQLQRCNSVTLQQSGIMNEAPRTTGCKQWPTIDTAGCSHHTTVAGADSDRAEPWYGRL